MKYYLHISSEIWCYFVVFLTLDSGICMQTRSREPPSWFSCTAEEVFVFSCVSYFNQHFFIFLDSYTHSPFHGENCQHKRRVIMYFQVRKWLESQDVHKILGGHVIFSEDMQTSCSTPTWRKNCQVARSIFCAQVHDFFSLPFYWCFHWCFIYIYIYNFFSLQKPEESMDETTGIPAKRR